jgi:hypothetical protein
MKGIQMADQPKQDIPWEFRELCRTDNISRAVKDSNIFPFDDWKWQITPASKNADAVVAQIESEALSEELVGPCLAPEHGLGSDDGKLAQIKEVVPMPATTFVPPALVKFANRVEEIMKRSSERSHSILNILGEFKNDLNGCPKNSEAWARLAHSCEDFVTAAIPKA